MPSFSQIPSNLLVPFVGVEFDSSQAAQGPALLSYRALIVGQKVAAGTAAANTVVRVRSAADALIAGGRGSMLHRQAIAWFASNTATEVWLGVLADDAGGVAATGTIVVAGTATAAGTIALYLGGVRLTIGVDVGDAAAAVAANVNAAINAALDLPITSGVSTATVTCTFRHKGLAGNSYDLRHSYRDGETLPAGLTLTITAMGAVVAGTTNPTLTTLLAALGDVWYQIIAHPYTDATSLTAIEAEMTDRFGALRQIDGVAITSASGSFGTLTTLGSGRNSAHSVIVAQPGAAAITPPMEFAAEVAAVIAPAAAEDPARPFKTLSMRNAVPTVPTDRWTVEERDMLLREGIATTIVGGGDVVQLESIVTTYQVSAAGADDDAYRYLNTLLTLLYLRYAFRVRMLTRYPRHKLANDGTRFASGQAVMTPSLGKAEAVAWFLDMEGLGLVEGVDQFKRDIVVERSTTNPNRLDLLLPPDLINQLLVIAGQIQFRL